METSITPFRWYDKYYKQNRFEKNCSKENAFQLITHRKSLLPFQFKRNSSGQLINKWIIRKSCEDAETSILTPADQKFIEASMNWENNGEFTMDCDVYKSGLINEDELALLGKLVVGKKYRYSIHMAEYNLSVGSNLDLSFNNGSTEIISNLSTNSYFEGEFTATDVNLAFVIHNDGSAGPTDYIGIKEIQLVKVLEVEANDIVLDESLIKLNAFNSFDLIYYCGNDLGLYIPPGEYYSILIETDGTAYFSEVFSVLNFIPKKNPYYTLTWQNTCDIQDVIYSDLDCGYYNKLYLDQAVISKPEYPFTEESTQDGNKNVSVNFQKWEKKVSFNIAKCPEFISDALTAIKLHDTINLQEPLRIKQLSNDAAVSVKSVEYEVQPVLEDCFQSVVLKILLNDQYVDATCCNNNEKTPCSTCDLYYDYLNNYPPLDLIPQHYIILIINPEHELGIGLFEYIGSEWVEIEVEPAQVVCDKKDEAHYFFTGIAYILVPTIAEWGTTSKWDAGAFHIYGVIPLNTYAQVQYSTDGGSTWTTYPQVVDLVAFVFFGVHIPYPFPDVTPQVVDIRIKNYKLNCAPTYSGIESWEFSE